MLLTDTPVVTASPRIVHVVKHTGEVRLNCEVTAVPRPNVSIARSMV